MINKPIPLLQAIKAKMNWHSARQTLLAQNVANADTPGYVGRDLRTIDLTKPRAQFAVPSLSTSRTNPGHINAGSSFQPQGPGEKSPDSFETTPDLNNVVLEEQMMKATANQLDYQAATTLYSRSLGLLRSAIRRS